MLVQAVGQMITDDWSSGVSFEWDNIEADYGWRFSAPCRDQLQNFDVLCDDKPIDIEGRLWLVRYSAANSSYKRCFATARC